VDPNISSLPEGREIESLVVSPPVVTLTGSPSALAAVEYVRTEPIRLRSTTTGIRVGLQIPEGLKAVRDDSVRISVQLRGRSAPAAGSGGNVSRPAPEAPAERDVEGGPPEDEEGPEPAERDDTAPTEPEPPDPDDGTGPRGTPGEPGEPGEDEEPTPAEPEQPDEDPAGPSE
jgi:hypothetical protein